MINLAKVKKGAPIPSQGAYSTFNDHEDYVRLIDYSQSMGRLFSASDDGKLFMWDLHVEKILQKYNTFDEERNEKVKEKSKAERFVNPQISHSMEIFGKNTCPTALASSVSGNLIFVAFTDDSFKMIDIRQQDVMADMHSGGHTGMIKSIIVSADESVVCTGGCDGTLRMWDIGQRSVIQTFGTETQEMLKKKKLSPFHQGTIF